MPRKFGDYILLQELGRGGMGVVYRARQTSLNRLVALKMILSGRFATGADRKRFRKEAETAANLDHPNIVPIYEVGEHEEMHFYSMKLIEGSSLAGQMPEYGKDTKATARLLAMVARAVHHAHQRGVLHRDLKPGNILIDPKGQPHLADFGLAKGLGEDGSLTLTDGPVGTPRYMAPEQADNRSDRLTPAADIFSLGAMLYEMLTGRVPFQADSTPQTLKKLVEEEPPPPSTFTPGLDRSIETICLKCLEKDPLRRYASAEALAEDLERWLDGRPILARRAGVAERVCRWMARHPIPAALLIGLVLLAAWRLRPWEPPPVEYTFSTIAGMAGQPGSADGKGSAARFNGPRGLALGPEGVLYVADFNNNVVRKISAAGDVTTPFGVAGHSASVDGVGREARFLSPSSVAVDRSNNLYVLDGGTTIRRISPDGKVTTFAGSPGVIGDTDGPGAKARFDTAAGLSIDAAGELFLANNSACTIRKVSPEGWVTTLAGAYMMRGSDDGAGPLARFYYPSGTAVDAAGNVYVADARNHTIRKIDPSGMVSTVAGRSLSAGCVDGEAHRARFDQPRGMSFDRAGNLYVADQANHVIRKITPAGMVSTLAGLPGIAGAADGVAAARFREPRDVVVDAADTLYVLDEGNNTIRLGRPIRAPIIRTAWKRIIGEQNRARASAPSPSPAPTFVAAKPPPSDTYVFTYTFTTLAGKAGVQDIANGPGPEARFSSPRGIALAGDGTLYVADVINNAIRKIAPEGYVSTLAGQAGVGGWMDGSVNIAQFNRPEAVTTDRFGNIYVADTGNATIRKISSEGMVSTLAGLANNSGAAEGKGSAARFSAIGLSAIAPGRDGNLFVVDNENQTIWKVTTEGEVTVFAGSPGEAGVSDGRGRQARFFHPSGAVVDPSGNVFVSDTWNNTIRKITSDGDVTTLAGKARSPGSANGAGELARFNLPRGLAQDRDGNLYVADQGNHTIRRITPAGLVTTLGGTREKVGSDDGTGPSARFNNPVGIAVDAAGRIYVADSGNHTIRLGRRNP